MLTSLKHRLEELDEMETLTSFSEAPQTNLAPIPIPKFSGRIWEWDTFWGAFKHSVDSREMDDLYKMNYLLDALQGEAKETVKQFEHHLVTCSVNPKLAREVTSNTYVDNIIVTTSSEEEALQYYTDSKQLFNDLRMNLREFRSNDETLNARIAPADLSANTLQKVLAALETRLRLGHSASVEHQQEWQNIVEGADGFEISLPREVAHIDTNVSLVLFADASSHGMAACAYLVSGSDSHIIAGKSKLPSIKDKPTIPKLELNALTMAMRLAYSIYEASVIESKLKKYASSPTQK
ncbi:unnamed protein product [Haemonchus placei]|uniref:RT_RNaseH_2 domain-containing protein n=1 Tax=Haemonchus placei TaxID=6290 RepID=A0A0N4X471_HAEPC|nr:unnamed protein product [Haemonchus placei]